MEGEAGRRLAAEVSHWAGSAGIWAPVVTLVPAHELTSRAASPDHQGIVAEADPYPYAEAETALENHDLVMALDRVQDPHNLGAVIRTAHEVGAAIAIPRHRAATVTPAVVKASAGATEHATIVQVRNLTDFIEQAKKAGFWVYGAEADADEAYDGPDYRGPTVFVLGSEGEGLSDRVAGACDVRVGIPLQGRIGSLNVSVAAAVLLFEAVRQRRRPMEQLT